VSQTAAGDDVQLIARFRAGEREVFGRIMERHLEAIYAVARGVLGNPDEAEDAAQEVFIKLYHHLNRLAPDSCLRAWLHRVCVNQCIDRQRRRARGPVELTPEEWEHMPDAAGDPQQTAERRELQAAVRRAVAELPRQQRQAFFLRHFGGLSVAEVAAAMGCAPGTVKTHLSRATAHLRAALGPQIQSGAPEVIRHE
jgi:RNA polymerase sigma-70 factor (ECF subfamily)